MSQIGKWLDVLKIPHHGTANAVATVPDPRWIFEEKMLRLILGRWLGNGQDEPRICTVVFGGDLPINKFREAFETSLIEQPLVPIQASTPIPKLRSFESTGVLGLSLDRNLQRARREGYEEVLDFAGKNLPWALFLVFIANPEGPHSKEALRTVWVEHGRTSDPEPESVVSEVKKLARRLRALGLAIPSTTLQGYRLVDAPKGKAS